VIARDRKSKTLPRICADERGSETFAKIAEVRWQRIAATLTSEVADFAGISCGFKGTIEAQQPGKE